MPLFWLHAGSLTHLLILFSLNSRDDFKFHFLLCRNLITSLRKFIIMSYFCMQFNIIKSTSPYRAWLCLLACLFACLPSCLPSWAHLHELSCFSSPPSHTSLSTLPHYGNCYYITAESYCPLKMVRFGLVT